MSAPGYQSSNGNGCDGNGWVHAGVVEVTAEGRVPLPERLRATGLLGVGDEGYWGVQTTTGRIVLSDSMHVGPTVRPISSRKVGGESDGYRLTVPFQFFPGDGESTAHDAQREGVPDEVMIEVGQELHFVFPDDRHVRWAYLLSGTQLGANLALCGDEAAKPGTSTSSPLECDRRPVITDVDELDGH